jgi:mediator of RNA polymerase II transcription subunit 14
MQNDGFGLAHTLSLVTNQLSEPSASTTVQVNGIHHDHEPTLEELEMELPMVDGGQIYLGDLVSRVAQAIYAELAEMAET